MFQRPDMNFAYLYPFKYIPLIIANIIFPCRAIFYNTIVPVPLRDSIDNL